MNDKIISILRKRLPEIKIIYLFGSQASGHAKPDSDIDIAIMAEEKLDPIVRWELANHLAKELHRDVDLVDLLQCSTILQMEIIRHGRLIYQADQAAERFEMTALSMYQHLQKERGDIIAAFQQGLKE